MKKLLVTLLCIVMVVSLMPAMTFAQEGAEAKIGDVEYATLKEAFENAEDEDVIVLLDNVVIDETIVVDKNYIYFYLDGHEISTKSLEDEVAFHVAHSGYGFTVCDEFIAEEDSDEPELGGDDMDPPESDGGDMDDPEGDGGDMDDPEGEGEDTGDEITGPTYGSEKDRFDAKIYVEALTSVAVRDIFFDINSIVYDKDKYVPVVMKFNEFGFDYLFFDVCEEEDVLFAGASQKCEGIYFNGAFEGDESDELLKEALGLGGKNPEEFATHVEYLPLSPNGKMLNSNWWNTYAHKDGASHTETLDWNYEVAQKYRPDWFEKGWYFNSSYFKGYEIEKWVEVIEYEFDDDGVLTTLVLGDEVSDEIDERMTLAPVWKRVETPKVDSNSKVNEVTVVADLDEQEKAIKSANKLIDDIADGKDSTVKVDSNIEQMIKGSLESGVDDFEVYTEAKVDRIEKDSVSSTEQKLISEEARDGKIAQYLDLSLEVSVIGFEADIHPGMGKIRELDETITFDMAIPESLKNTDKNVEREYYVVRVHDGEAETIDVKANEDGTLSFETDKFSTYALAYKDTAKTSATPDSGTTETPKTGETNAMMLWVVLMAMAVTGAVNLKKKITK